MWKDTEVIDNQRDWGAGAETPSGIQNQYARFLGDRNITEQHTCEFVFNKLQKKETQTQVGKDLVETYLLHMTAFYRTLWCFVNIEVIHCMIP